METSEGQQLSFKDLRKRQHSFIYGSPGTGKTTFRINLDADCRTILDQTFSVNYVLGQEIKRPLDEDEHGQRLAQAMARDCFVQIIEQYIPNHPVTDQQLTALCKLLELGGQKLKRLVKQILKEPEPKGYAGLADHWRSVGRIPVRFTAASPALLDMLRIIQTMESGLSSDLQGWEQVTAAQQAAQAWHGEAILILVDGVDAVKRSPQEMFTYISPLLRKLSSLSRNKIFLKFFLPLEIAPSIDAWLRSNASDLYFSAQKVTIVWTEQALHKMLQQRFSAAGTRYKGLNELAQGKLQQQLDKLILSEAKGSPRRMLWLVSNLINSHVANQPEQVKIDENDWASMHELGSALLEGST